MKNNLTKYKLFFICCILFIIMACITYYVLKQNERVNNIISNRSDEVQIIQMQKLNGDITPLQQIYMVNMQTGWALTADNELLYTDNGIDDFQIVKEIQAAEHYVHLTVINETTVYLAYFEGEDIIVEYSRNMGAEWAQTRIPYREYGDAGTVFINFADEQNGYLLYCSTPGLGQMTKILFKTTDGGESFEMISDLSNEISGYPTGFAYSNSSDGYISTTYHGEDKYLFYTSDGGVIWSSIELEGYEVQELSYVEAYPPVFFGEDNKEGKLILKYVGIEKNSYVEYVTHDCGSTWKISSLLDCDSISNYTYFEEGGYWIDQDGNILIF